MKKWKWDAEAIKHYEQSTMTPALKELIKRSGAARIHATRDLLAVEAIKLTYRQRKVIEEFIIRHHPPTVIIDLEGKHKVFDSPYPWDIEEFLTNNSE